MNTQLAEKYNDIEIVKNKFLEKIANLSDEQLNKPAENGGWSAGQIIYHCAFVESSTILLIEKNLSENKTQLKSDIGSVFRNMLLVLFLKLPFKYKAPKIVSSVPATTQMNELVSYYKKNKLDFTTLLQNFPVELEENFIFKHPMLGLFNIHQVLTFLREHYLHHERQLDALL